MAAMTVAPSAVRSAAACASGTSRRSTRAPTATLSARPTPAGLGLVRHHRQPLAPVCAMPVKEKSITREDEPDEYWQSKAEAGGNVMKDPLAIIGAVSIFLPFVLLLIAAAVGLVDLTPRV